ncbi:MAG: 2Fe-2S iron-sulfur cluster-binding protein [Myxococcota bacterium]|jgi:NADH-quinone oxidoreductase subunit G|nr:2Fe-2S iron-sulfur cluster-binding protein [Myxococcota bacterium]
MPVVKINGTEVEVPDGTNMIEAASQIGVEIPHYCYHPHLTVAGNCRMCLVDIEAGGRGPDIACNMVARDGLAIRTDTDQVVQMRKSVMEFLLVNHPLDCPICDQAGECRLQDYYMDYGAYESRLRDSKVAKAKRQDIGTGLVLDSERCVQCSRCVRFGDEVTETGELRLFNRTDHTQIGVFPGTKIEHSYQGCLADVCPVGALTLKDFRFEKRVWYLRETPSVCDGCATGCNIRVCHQQGEVFRYLPRRNDAVNKSWMCDPGRKRYKNLAPEGRVLRSRIDGAPATVDEALTSTAHTLRQVSSDKGAASIGLVLGARGTNEGNWALLQAIRANFPEARVFTCEGNDPEAFEYHDELLVSHDKNANTVGTRLLRQSQEGIENREALSAALTAGDLGALLVLQDDVLGRLGLDAVPGLIYLGTRINGSSQAAQVVLPVAAHVEVDGSFTNGTGRVQRLRMAMPPRGDSRPGYELATLLGAALGTAPDTGSASRAFGALAAVVPAYQGLSLDGLGAQGQQAQAPAAEAEASPTPTEA